MTLSIAQLKAQRRWVLWRLEKRDGKETKVPYQSNGHHADSTEPRTWMTYAEVEPHAHRFSGVGVVMGEVDGIHLCGVDIDNCCDAVTGKFTPESREIVIGLDSYSEFSPSGTGAHILMLGTLRGHKGIKLPFPGAKAVELYDSARYLTFTGRHLEKTPLDVVEREDAVNALYDRVVAAKPNTPGLTVSISVSESERLAMLMNGDMSLYHDDHSTADFALCCLLAKKHDCNAFQVDAEFRESKLYREKWERDDYRENTIARAIKSVAREAPVVFDTDGLGEDGDMEYLVESKDGPDAPGWFPKGELSLIGAPSGVGKTSWTLPLLEDIREGREVWGHKTKPCDYRVFLHDRSKRAMRATAKAMHMSDEAYQRIIRLTTTQQSANPADVLAAGITANPGVEVWFIEGLDLWIPEMNKMDVVAPIMDSLQRVATLHNVALIASVGAPKQKGPDKYAGRDGLFGSSALARKAETVVLLRLTDEKDPNSTREVWVMPRNAKSEVMYFTWRDGRLVETAKPEDVKPDESDSTFHRMTNAVQSKFGTETPIKYLPSLGAERTFYRWKDWAQDRELIHKHKNRWYMMPRTGGVVCGEEPQESGRVLAVGRAGETQSLPS
ncbi:MAG: hypothetical protein P4L40_24345 [Terracidiphilus sp.]|nr:hypothetical protein [Terracidiphilus sp.]